MNSLLLRACVLGLLALSACRASEESPPPETLSLAGALLARSVRFHDPNEVWGREPIAFTWTSTRPNGDVGYVFHITLDPDGTFSMHGERRGSTLEYRVANDVSWARVDGEENLTNDVKDRMALARDDGVFWRDYLGFLGVLPLNLQHAGVRIAPDVIETKLEDRDVLAIRADFAPEVGTDVYTFYFDPKSAELVGCRFDRADPTRDGETIVYEGLVDASGVRLPERRRWFMNADARYLGMDEIAAGDR